MWARITGFLTAVGLILGAAVALLLKGRADGKREAEAKRNEQYQKAAQAARDTAAAVHRESDPAGRLRDKWSRD